MKKRHAAFAAVILAILAMTLAGCQSDEEKDIPEEDRMQMEKDEPAAKTLAKEWIQDKYGIQGEITKVEPVLKQDEDIFAFTWHYYRENVVSMNYEGKEFHVLTRLSDPPDAFDDYQYEEYVSDLKERIRSEIPEKGLRNIEINLMGYNDITGMLDGKYEKGDFRTPIPHDDEGGDELVIRIAYINADFDLKERIERMALKEFSDCNAWICTDNYEDEESYGKQKELYDEGRGGGGEYYIKQYIFSHDTFKKDDEFSSYYAD